MQTLQGALEKSVDRYWADRTLEQIFAVSAWVAHAEGARDKAIALMRKAADARRYSADAARACPPSNSKSPSNSRIG